MQTDIEDVLADQWRSVIEDDLAYLTGQQSALEGQMRGELTVRPQKRIEESLALRRCRQLRSRVLALWRLTATNPYAVREALDWADTHQDLPLQFRSRA